MGSINYPRLDRENSLCCYNKLATYTLLLQQNKFSMSNRVIEPMRIIDKPFRIRKTDNEGQIFETIISNK